MQSYFRRATVLIVCLSAAWTSAAGAAEAVLENLSGNPRIYEVGEAGVRTVSLPRRGASYTLPIEIETGAADTATFRLPDSDVAVAPNTVLRVAAPEPAGGGLLQRIFQKAGSSLFSVDRREVEHFEVETPYLVSVVKGTTFTVVVYDEGATVSLHEGRLDVTSLDGSRQVALMPGDVAYANRHGELEKLESTPSQQAAADGVDATGSTPLSPGLAAEAAGGADDATAVASAATDTTGLPEPLDLSDAVGELSWEDSDTAADAGDDLVAGLADETADLATDLGATGDDPTADLGDDTGDLTADLGDTGTDLAGDLGDAVGAVGDVAASTGDLAGDVADTTGDAIGDLADTAGDVTGDLADTAGDVAGDAAETAGDLTGDVTGTVGDLTGDVTEPVGDLTEDLADTTEDLVDDVSETTDGLTGGLVGGLRGLL